MLLCRRTGPQIAPIRQAGHERIWVRSRKSVNSAGESCQSGRRTAVPRRLSELEVKQYHEQGYCSPITVMSPAEATACLERLDRAVAAHSEEAAPVLRMKSHLVFGCLNELVHLPAILDAVEDVLGPDILAWTSSMFAKDARDPSYVSWHQDLTYWGLAPPSVTTAWLALSPSKAENGCMRVIPGSHKQEIVDHRDTFAKGNMLSRGQEIAVEFDHSRAIDLELEPGQMSLHHVKLFHASNPNTSAERRYGYSIRYIASEVRQVLGAGDSATHVRGRDPGHFSAEPSPEAEFDRAALARHADICASSAKVLFR